MVQGRKTVVVGVWKGGGPPPGYEWTVLILSVAVEEAMACLSESQYEHLAGLVRHLATHANPTMSNELDLDRVGTFFELREKGGGLGNPTANVRVYFDRDEKSRTLRVLGFDWKKKEGPIAFPVRERIERRQRKWDKGDYPLAGN